VNRHLYSLLFTLCLPLMLVRLLWRARRAPDYARRIGERLGYRLPVATPSPPTPLPLTGEGSRATAVPSPARGRGCPAGTGEGSPPAHGIWLHAVSVGEAIAAAPLVHALLARHPGLPITVTCMTPTGSARIQALFGNRVHHCYLPYDLPGCVRRFLHHVQPALAIIMETELWPNYLHQCAQRGIPVVLANARLSERSARGYARFPRLTRPMFASLAWLAVQSEAEAARFRALGARPETVSVTGSVKYDLHPDPAIPARAAALREQWGFAARPVWIAASTHPGEDETVLAAHRQVLASRPDTLLILVPRHPERFDPVWQLCRAQKFNTARRSTNAAVSPNTQILLGDTMGELLLYYALADLAFVGGSLVAHGGHNLLEPVALAKPVLTGPHVFNFHDIATRLRSAGALLDVSDAQTLSTALLTLWATPTQTQTRAALDVLHANQGALGRLLDGIATYLPTHTVSSPP